MRRPDHAVLVVLRLVGEQSTRTVVQHPGTPEATVTVRIGKSLLYLHQAQTVEHLHRVWRDAGSDAPHLPRTPDRTLLRHVEGMTEPGVVTHATGRPAASSALVKPRGTSEPYLRVQIGRVSFEVRDLPAFGTCLAAFGRAAELAETAFKPGPALSRGARAAATAAAAAIAPTTELDQLAQLATFLGDRLARHTHATQPRHASQAQPTQPRPGGRTP